MDRNRQIAALSESEEERLLLVRVCEKLERAQLRQMPAASAFLTVREQTLVRLLLPRCAFFGGTEGAERKVAYYLPEYLDEEAYWREDAPIAALRAYFYEPNALSHRDMLGALMGAGVRRDTVGDICLHETFCDFFVLAELAPYLLQQLTSAGRQHLRVERIALSEAKKPPQEMKQLRLSVSSLRLDSLVAAAFHLSRGAAAEAIHAAMVAVNGLTCCKPDRAVAEQDEISLRGKGKLRLLSLNGETRRGRLAVTVGLYR